jgi:Cyclin D1 binding domain
VHTRILEAADFEAGREHDAFGTYDFGSEGMYRGTSTLSRADIQPGVRMIEAIKVRGDVNVPSAQVTWRAFIVPHLAEQGVPWAAPRSKTKREHAPFPFSKYGRSFPGVGRIASHGFRSPQWTQATVHITSPDEIRVTWLQSTACCKRIWGL